MKKKVLLTAALSALAVGALAGCQKSSGPNGWSKLQKEMMQEALYGEVLPYVNGIKNLALFSNEEATVISLTGKGATAAKLEKYAEKYEDAEWTFYPNEDYEYVYTFEKEVQLEEGSKYIRTQFYSCDEDGFPTDNGKGDFYLIAQDPYYYEWPTDYVLEVADYFGSNVTVPPVNASRYEVFGENLNIVAYDLIGEDPVSAYLKDLTDNDFTILSVQDSYGYRLATSKDSKFTVSFKYFAKENAMDIYFEAPKFESWPADGISSLFQKYEQTGYYVLPINGASLYALEEDPYNELYIMFDEPGEVNAVVTASGFENLETTYNGYKDALKTAGWTFAEDSDAATIEKDGYKYRMNLSMDTDNDAINVQFYLYGEKLPSKLWPGAELVAALPSYVTDIIPEFIGENNGFKLDASSWTVTVLVDSATAIDELNSYGAYLVENNWTAVTSEESSTYYKSENEQLLAYLGIYNDGEITIRFELGSVNKDSPMDEFSACLEDIGLKKDIFPSFSIEGASWSFMPFDKEGKTFTVSSDDLGYTDGEVLFRAIKGNLLNSSFVDVTEQYSSEPSETDLYFAIEEENILVNLYCNLQEPDPEVEGDVGMGYVYIQVSYVSFVGD